MCKKNSNFSESFFLPSTFGNSSFGGKKGNIRQNIFVAKEIAKWLKMLDGISLMFE
jgi:hypothetical protein